MVMMDHRGYSKFSLGAYTCHNCGACGLNKHQVAKISKPNRYPKYLCAPCAAVSQTAQLQPITENPMDDVKHPSHYILERDGKTYECLELIEALDLDYHLGNVMKYIWRAGKKPDNAVLKDLKKAQVYLARRIELAEKG